MAVVNITGGNFSGSGSGTIYTCPSGRSARVELFITRFGTTNQTEVAGGAWRASSSGTLGVFGNNPQSAGGYAKASHTSTVYVPASGSLTFYDVDGSYVAIEEDDG